MSDRVSAAVFIALAMGVAVTLAGCAPDAAPPDASVTRVAFYGDSYTLGTGASDLTNRWSTIICAERDWDEFNPSANGLGFVNRRTVYGDGDLPSRIIANDPDILFITMGLNDNFSYESRAPEIEAQITADLERLSDALPETRIIVVEPFWYTDDRPASVEIIIGWVKDAAESIGADYIPGASHWIEGHPEWMASDGLHPNDDGYAAMAVHMDEELAKLGL